MAEKKKFSRTTDEFIRQLRLNPWDGELRQVAADSLEEEGVISPQEADLLRNLGTVAYVDQRGRVRESSLPMDVLERLAAGTGVEDVNLTCEGDCGHGPCGKYTDWASGFCKQGHPIEMVEEEGEDQA